MAAEVLLVILAVIVSKAHAQVSSCGPGSLSSLSGLPGPGTWNLPIPLQSSSNVPSPGPCSGLNIPSLGLLDLSLQNPFNGPCQDVNGILGGPINFPSQNLINTPCLDFNVPSTGFVNLPLNRPSLGPCTDVTVSSFGPLDLSLRNLLNGNDKDCCLPLNLPPQNILNSPLPVPCAEINVPFGGSPRLPLPLQNSLNSLSLDSCKDFNLPLAGSLNFPLQNLLNRPLTELCDGFNIPLLDRVTINELFAAQAKNLGLQNIINRPLIEPCSTVNIPIPKQLPIIEPFPNNLGLLNSPDIPCLKQPFPCTPPSLPSVVGIPIPVISNTIVDNSFSNSLGNALQLLIVSDLIKSTLNCGSCNSFIETASSIPVFSNVDVIAPVCDGVSNVDVTQTTIVENNPNFYGQSGFTDFSYPNYGSFDSILPNQLVALLETFNNIKSGSLNPFNGLPDVNLRNFPPFGPITPNRFGPEFINPGISPPLVPIPSNTYGFGIPDIISPINLPSVGPILPNIYGSPDFGKPCNEFINPGVLPPLVPTPLNSCGFGLPDFVNPINLPTMGPCLQNVYGSCIPDFINPCNEFNAGTSPPFVPASINSCGFGLPDLNNPLNVPNTFGPNLRPGITDVNYPCNEVNVGVSPSFVPCSINSGRLGLPDFVNSNLRPSVADFINPCNDFNAGISPNIPNIMNSINIPSVGPILPNVCRPCVPEIIDPLNLQSTGPIISNMCGCNEPNIFRPALGLPDISLGNTIPQFYPNPLESGIPGLSLRGPIPQNICGNGLPEIIPSIASQSFSNIYGPNAMNINTCGFSEYVTPINVSPFGPEICEPGITDFIIPVNSPVFVPNPTNIYEALLPEVLTPLSISPFELATNIEVLNPINCQPISVPQNQYVSYNPELATSLPVNLCAAPEIPIALSPLNSYVLEIPTLEIELSSPTIPRSLSSNIFGCASEIVPRYAPEYELVLPSSIPAQLVCSL